MKGHSTNRCRINILCISSNVRWTIFTVLLFWLFFHSAQAQDYLKTNDGRILNVRISEVTLSEIKYRNKNDSILYSIPRSDVSAFKYMALPGDSTAATPDYFPETKTIKSPMYMKGVHDAEIHYGNYRTAAKGTFWAAVIVGPGPALIPAFITTSIGPTEKNLCYTDTILMNNPDYKNGYTTYAKEKKTKKVWRGYLGGMIINLALVIVFFSAAN